MRYLESRLIGIAQKAGLSVVQNGTAPDFALLPEADLSDMEFFIEQLRIVLPVLGLNILRERECPVGGRWARSARCGRRRGSATSPRLAPGEQRCSPDGSAGATSRYRPTVDGRRRPSSFAAASLPA